MLQTMNKACGLPAHLLHAQLHYVFQSHCVLYPAKPFLLDEMSKLTSQLQWYMNVKERSSIRQVSRKKQKTR